MLRIITAQQADYNNISILVAGDGVSTILIFKVNETPFNVDYRGKLPDSIFITNFDETFSATATLAIVGADTVATVTFDPPLPNNTDLNTGLVFSVNLQSIWNSL